MKLLSLSLLSFAAACQTTSTDRAVSQLGESDRKLAVITPGGLEESVMYEEPTMSRVTIPTRLFVGSDLADPGNDPVLEVVSRGVALKGHDGGIQSFQDSTYDCSVDKTYQSFAIAAFASPRCESGGPGRVQSTGVFSNAPGGFSFLSHTGTLRNDGPAALSAPLTVGEGPAVANTAAFYTNVEIDGDRRVSLGNNVANFTVSGAGAEPQVGLGMSGGYPQQLLVKNVHQGAAGALMFADTKVASDAHAGVSMYRGTAATPATWRAGIHVGTGGGQFAFGDTENALVMWSYDATDESYGIELATGSTPTVRLRVRADGRVEVLSGMAVSGPVGFYGAQPIAKQTNVPVTCEGVHAALVKLGLIE